MKKQIPCLTLLTVLLMLPSCTEDRKGMVFSLSTGEITKDQGDVRLMENEKPDYVNPFSTVILGNLYYYSGDYTNAQLQQISKEFQETYSYLHALTDRHYDYTYQGEKIRNLKTLNESYGTEQPIVLDEYLYPLLKKSYEFSLASEGKFNLFLGQLNDIYETKLPLTTVPTTALDCAWMETCGFRMGAFSGKQKEDIRKYVSMIPKTKEEISKVLTFNDEDRSVVFHLYQNEDGVTNPALSISLGGNGKGMATQFVSDKLEAEYPGISLFINSGNSSLKAIGERPDGSLWKIRYTNPAYAQFCSYPYGNSLINPYNPSEIVYSKQGAFNLSTSGFYEQYFYTYQEETKDFVLNSHILNPETGYSNNTFDCVSVYLDDTGLADMYTTALMNCASVSEADSLFDSLNQYYHEEEAELLLCQRENTDLSSLYSLSSSDFSSLSSYGTPICLTNTGKRYEGDYSDITDYHVLQSSVSSYQSSFAEVYYCTSGMAENLRLLEKDEAQLDKPVRSQFKTLE